MTRTDPSPRGVADRLRAFRSRVRRTRTGRLAWRISVSVLGVVIIVAGIVLLPLPGPGWLIIFAGLGLLATEFEWANRLLQFARRQVSSWTSWAATQPRWVQGLIGLAGLALLAGVAYLAYVVYLR